MKTIIAGSRTVNKISHIITAIEKSGFKISCVLSGVADGADALGETWAQCNQIPILEFPARWSIHGRKAGILRNIEMADNAEALIAVWDGKSKGTAHMIKCATEKGLRIYVHRI